MRVYTVQRLDRNPIISNIICNNWATHRLRMKYEKNINLARRMRFRQTYRIRSFLWWHLIYRFWLELQSSFLPRLTLRTTKSATSWLTTFKWKLQTSFTKRPFLEMQINYLAIKYRKKTYPISICVGNVLMSK